MTQGDWHDSEIEALRHRWIAGDFRAVAEAFALCAWRKRATPDWLTEPVLEGLLHYFNHGGAEKGGRGGGNRSQAHLAEMHSARASAYELALLEGGRGAAKRASEMLQGTLAWGDPRQIKRSYDKVKATSNRR